MARVQREDALWKPIFTTLSAPRVGAARRTDRCTKSPRCSLPRKPCKRCTQIDTADVDDVILGCVTPVGEQGADIARVAVLNADYAQTTAGVQVNRFCASGLEAVNIAAAKVHAGEADFAIGGGVEHMSRVPMGSDGGAMAFDPAVAWHTYFAPQGIGADLIATKFGFSRTDCDAYAVESQKRAAQAWKEGRFAKTIVPVKDVIGQVVTCSRWAP